MPKKTDANSTAISVENLSKSYRLFSSPRERIREALHPFRKQYHKKFWALRDVSFEVPTGSTMGILGANGSGKSTLLQTLASVLKPTNGTISVNGRISALLELGAGFDLEFSGRSNVIFDGILKGISQSEMLKRMPQIEEFAQIGQYIDQPVKTYSSGMFLRLAFAAAVNSDPDIILIDEALSVGDAKFQQRCYERLNQLQEMGKTILLISHDVEAVINHCERCLLFDKGQLVGDGEPNAVADQYREILFFDVAKAATSDNTVFNSMKSGEEETEISQPSTLEEFLEDRTLNDKCPYRPSYNNNEVQYGGELAQVVDFFICANKVVYPKTLPFGDSIEVYVKVRSEGNNFVPEFGFSIRTVNGIYVYGTNTIMNPNAFHRIENDDQVVYKTAMNSKLQRGDYFMDIGVFRRSGVDNIRLHARRQMIHFSVDSTPWFDGLVDIEELETTSS